MASDLRLLTTQYCITLVSGHFAVTFCTRLSLQISNYYKKIISIFSTVLNKCSTKFLQYAFQRFYQVCLCILVLVRNKHKRKIFQLFQNFSRFFNFFKIFQLFQNVSRFFNFFKIFQPFQNVSRFFNFFKIFQLFLISVPQSFYNTRFNVFTKYAFAYLFWYVINIKERLSIP